MPQCSISLDKVVAGSYPVIFNLDPQVKLTQSETLQNLQEIPSAEAACTRMKHVDPGAFMCT